MKVSHDVENSVTLNSLFKIPSSRSSDQDAVRSMPLWNVKMEEIAEVWLELFSSPFRDFDPIALLRTVFVIRRSQEDYLFILTPTPPRKLRKVS